MLRVLRRSRHRAGGEADGGATVGRHQTLATADAGRRRDGRGGYSGVRLLQLQPQPDRLPLHSARREAILHQVLRVALRQRLRGLQNTHRHRFQGNSDDANRTPRDAAIIMRP